MGPAWVAAFVIMLAGPVHCAAVTCGKPQVTDTQKLACWIADWQQATCYSTNDHDHCKKLAQASFDDEYVCCNAIAHTGRWNGSKGPQGVCANLSQGECVPTGKLTPNYSGSWKCTDKRSAADSCWFPDFNQRTCLKHTDATFCTQNVQTVYKTPEYCCDMLSWGGMWRGKRSAQGVCTNFCTPDSQGNFFCGRKSQSAVVTSSKTSASGDCVCHEAVKNETWKSIAADYGTTPHTIFQDNSDANPNGYPNPGCVYQICAAPGPERKRFRPGGRKQRFTGCLDDTYVRPCTGYSGDARKACFCSYRDNGQYQWPFEDGVCNKLIECQQHKPTQFVTCAAGKVVHEIEDENGSITASCVDKPDNFVCTAGCADHACICRDLLLPTGTYQNPFDWDERSGIKCSYSKGNPQWFDGVTTCSLGKYDAKTKECVSELEHHCKKQKSYAGCQAFYPPPEVGCPDKKRKLMAATLSWGTATDRTCNWWIGPRCVCPAQSRAWSTNFGCSYPTCAGKPRNACRNGGGITKQPATKTRDICACEYNGGCPYMFYRNCAYRW